jgi:hypothetical protein
MDFYAFDSRPTMASMALGSGRTCHPRRHGMAFDAERERAPGLHPQDAKGRAPIDSSVETGENGAGSLRKTVVRTPLEPAITGPPGRTDSADRVSDGAA